MDALAALINNILRMLRSGSYTQVATTIARIERDLAQVSHCTCCIIMHECHTSDFCQ